MHILDLAIEVTGVQEVRSTRGTARMILRQFLNSDGSGTLSARYTLSGTACDGTSARLFIENNARMGEETHPRIFTDSPCLAFLETAKLVGHIHSENGHLRITIDTLDDAPVNSLSE